MKRESISIKWCSIAQLLRQLDAGHFAIPRLQREFVWNGPKAAKLLDSILRGMPVGVMLIWETPKSQLLHLRQRYHVLPPFSRSNPKVWFLIDGQQRVSVLHHVRQGDQLLNSRRQEIDFSKVVLSLKPQADGQQIRYRRPTEGEHVSLGTVLHPHWRQKLNGLSMLKLARARECRQLVLNYRLYQMFVRGDLGGIRETFLRINTQGMKVTTADAVFTQAEDLDLRDVVHALREQLDEKFANMEDEPLLFLLAAIQGGTEARGQAIQTTIAKLNKRATKDLKLRKSLAEDWSKLGPCMGKAVNYLRENFAVVSRDFLASDYILSMLAYFYYLNGSGPNRMQGEQIRRWFWATSVGSRYSGRDFNRCVPQDLKFFRALAEKSGTRFRYTPQVDAIDIRRAQYSSRTAITSAVYCMLLRRGPVYLRDKGLNEIPLHVYAGRANRKDRHHIFPRLPLSNADVPSTQYNSIANICLLVAEENQRIGAKRPSMYLADLNRPGMRFGRKMNRHLIPVDDSSGVWDKNLRRGFRRFLQQRTELLCSELEKEAGIRLFRRDGRG
jgi:hypothetical protein